MRGVELQCPPFRALIGGKIRTAAEPCGAFCNNVDARGWKAAALEQIKATLLARPDLPEPHKARLRDNATRLESMAESVWDVGEQTRMFARIAEDAHCLAFWDPATPPPIVPVTPTVQTGENPLRSLIYLAGLGLAIVLVMQYGSRR